MPAAPVVSVAGMVQRVAVPAVVQPDRRQAVLPGMVQRVAVPAVVQPARQQAVLAMSGMLVSSAAVAPPRNKNSCGPVKSALKVTRHWNSIVGSRPSRLRI